MTEPDLPPELAQAGEMVERLIGHLTERHLPPLAIASALLGGSIGLMIRSMAPGAVLDVLDRASRSVRSGEFERVSEGRTDE